MAVTPESLRALFCELEGVADAKLQPWIDEAERNVCRPSWLSRADDGVSYLAMHLFTVFGSSKSLGGGPFGFGAVSSKKVDQVSVSYAVGESFRESDLGSTAYGRRFISLRRLIFAPRCI